MLLQVEVRLPVDMQSSQAKGTGESYVERGSLSGIVQRKGVRRELRVPDARHEGGRWIVPGSVYVFTTRGQRMHPSIGA